MTFPYNSNYFHNFCLLLLIASILFLSFIESNAHMYTCCLQVYFWMN
uniref:Uncharacterized protein n=1 Tax=Rhizophora mucronata TaxID=61149 RepID=A0A2P2R015_RHIMU